MSVTLVGKAVGFHLDNEVEAEVREGAGFRCVSLHSDDYQLNIFYSTAEEKRALGQALVEAGLALLDGRGKIDINREPLEQAA